MLLNDVEYYHRYFIQQSNLNNNNKLYSYYFITVVVLLVKSLFQNESAISCGLCTTLPQEPGSAD